MGEYVQLLAYKFQIERQKLSAGADLEIRARVGDGNFHLHTMF